MKDKPSMFRRLAISL